MYLSHLTSSLDNLVSILEIGFVFFPNERKLFAELTSLSGRPSLVEPQCRGMVCFTDTQHDVGKVHRRRYGAFGVAVNKEWAIRNGACKAIYLRIGSPMFEAFKSLFNQLSPVMPKTGDSHLDLWIDQLARSKPEFSKSLGATSYADLLKIHEYMQTDEDVADSEWRVLREHKFEWTVGTPLSEVKKASLLMAQNGIF
jgi:hypothetical protein